MRRVESFNYFQKPADAVSGPKQVEHKEIPKERLEYLGGYFDAAGQLSITEGVEVEDGHPFLCFGFRIALARMHKAPVNLLQETFPAPTNEYANGEKTRTVWQTTGLKAEKIFKQLAPVLRLKAGEVGIMRSYLALPENATENEIRDLKQKLNAIKRYPKPDLSKPFTDAYLAGFIDGHSYTKLISEKWGTRLVMKVNPASKEFSQAIVEQYTFLDPESCMKTLDKGYAVIGAGNARDLLKRVIRHLRVYKKLAAYAIAFQNVRESAHGTFEKSAVLDRARREEKIVRLFNEEFENVRKRQGPPLKAA